MERLPAWDPFYPTPGDPGPREASETPLVSLFLCLAGEQAVVCRVEGEHIGPRVSLVARHGTSPFTCGAPARALATIFLGAASGNILAFPARVQATNAGGSQVGRAKFVMAYSLKLQVSLYTLHGHLGGVLLLATTGLGDTLVSVGIDRVAKVVEGQPSCLTCSLRCGNFMAGYSPQLVGWLWCLDSLQPVSPATLTF